MSKKSSDNSRKRNDFELILKGMRTIQKKNRFFLLNSCLYAVFQSLQPFVGIYFSARIIDGILTRLPLEHLMCLVLWMAGLEWICTVVMKWMTGVMEWEQYGIFFSVRLDVAEKLFRIDYEKAEDPEVQRQKEKIETAADGMGLGLNGICETIPYLLQHGITIILSAAMTIRLFLHFQTGLGGWQAWVCSPVFSILLVAIILFSVFINMKLAADSRNKEYELVGGLHKLVNKLNYYKDNYIGNYHHGKDIQIYEQRTMLMKEMETETGKLGEWYRDVANAKSYYTNLASAISVSISGLVYLFVGLKALAGMFSVGNIVQYIGSINQFVNGMTEFMRQLTDLKMNREALSYYFDYMEMPETNLNDGIPITEEIKEIEFHDVSFKYPGTDQYILRHVSVTFSAGKKTAIVGMNGSGKTTLIKLLCGLYRPTEGSITLNGRNIRDYKYADYLKQLAVVFQDFKIFAYTLGENVSGNIDMDIEKIEDSLIKAGLKDRYSRLKRREKTYLTKEYDTEGVDVSGGEAQKIAIARALYKNAPIVILDEPTAALDPISEFDIYSRFNQMVEDKTAIFISHRLSSCRFCDEIVVLDSGNIIQMGNHESLVKDKEGKYYELWNAQAQYYNEEQECGAE